MNSPAERIPFELPISEPGDKRAEICNHYAMKLWRHTDVKLIAAILENLYEQAYSNGLKDMDKMHDNI